MIIQTRSATALILKFYIFNILKGEIMFEEEIQILMSLANGVNYFTGEVCEDDSILNDTNIVRTLFKVCEILRSENFGRGKTLDFVCPNDIEQKFVFEKQLNLTKFISKIKDMYPSMKRINFNQMTELLIKNGILKKVKDSSGSQRAVATEKANEYGIRNVKRSSMYGKSYNVVIYDIEGQKYLLSLLKGME